MTQYFNRGVKRAMKLPGMNNGFRLRNLGRLQRGEGLLVIHQTEKGCKER